MERPGFYTNGSVECYPLHQWENYNLVGEGQTLKCLKQLSLTGIEVDGGDIQLLLSKFPLLESLSMSSSWMFEHASIVGDSTSKLKHLDISRCGCRVGLIIENFVNLVSLHCNYMAYTLTLKNVPKLIEFSTCDSIGSMGYCTAARILARMPSSIPQQLQTLKIFTYKSSTPDYSSMLPQLVSLKNLELVDVIGYNDNKISCFQPLYLFQACPSLEKLEIKFECWGRVKVKGDESTSSLESMWLKSEKKLCPNLKKMKISGFIGSLAELGFVFSILTIIGALEELVVEACDKNTRIRNLATECAWRHFRSSASRVVVV